MKRRWTPVFMVATLIVVVIIIIVLGIALKKYIPSKEEVNLEEYLGLQTQEDLAIILDRQQQELTGKYMNERAYIDYETLHDCINQRFYWDSNENLLLYTTPTDVVRAEAGTMEYLAGKEQRTTDYTIVQMQGEKVFVALDFVELYANVTHEVFPEPNRAVVTSQWGNINVAQVKKDTELRVKGGIKSPIVTTVEKGSVVTVIETYEDWSEVGTQDGYVGYVQNKKLSEAEQQVLAHDFPEEIFTHITKDYKINMAWHQVTNQEANARIAEVLASTKNLTTISPTWFYLNDNNGNIASLGSVDYVNTCHAHGVEVWGLVSNLENKDVDTTMVLTHTSVRNNLVNQIIAAAIQYGLDGINLDFESLSVETGDAYIQFVRELSLKCRANGLVLSVDNYVPTEYTAFYNRAEQAVFADYIVVMAYDEHYVGSDEGSVSSLSYVTDGVVNTLAEVPAEQIILALPFYTRLWQLEPKDTAADDPEAASEDYVPYTITSTALGMDQAAAVLTDHNTEARWEEQTGQYYAEYQADGSTYRIWLEEETSLEEKLKVMQANNLAGVSFWKLGFERPSAWDVIIKYAGK